MKLNLKRPLAIFDLEATGLDVTNDRIVEIAILRVDIDGTTHEYTHKVNPGCPIPEEVSRIHGIYDKDVANEPTFGEIALEYVGIKESRSRASERTRYLDRGRLILHVLPKIGMFIPTDITSTEIKALAKGIEFDGHTETARRVLTLIN